MILRKIKNHTLIRIIAWTVVLIFVLSMAFTAFMLIHEDSNVNPNQGLPEIENGTLDFSSCDIGKKYLKQNLHGQYDFYYNHWIVEENYQGEPDAQVTVPHRWKGSTINDKRLDSSGYASYRLIVTGLPIGTPITFMNNNFIGAFYGYANGQLIYKYGTRNKEGESHSKGGYDFSEAFIVNNTEPLEIVFEVSSSTQGGLTSPPRLVIKHIDNMPTSPNLTNYIGLFVLGITLSLFIFSFFINFETKKDKRNLSFAIVMLVMTVLVVFSIDVYWRLLSFIPINAYNIIMDVNLFANIALLGALFLHFVKSNIIKSYKPWLIILSATMVVAIILYYALMGTFYQIIAPILQVICYISFVYPLMISFLQGKKLSISYVFLLLGILIYMICTTFDLMNIIINGLEQSISYLLLCINLYIIVLYRSISVENSKKLTCALKTQKEQNAIKADTLKSQIKPHFIFNSLTNIQAAYKQDLNLGDTALNIFSKHLRANVDFDSTKTVSFSIELENIMNYVELENMHRNKPVTVLLNCTDSDFQLPTLSLQPFIENAFKHSGVENFPNGFIEITTSETTSDFVVEINDNGIGFDVETVRPNSVGLKNACERLRLVSDATVTIKSKKGKGTRINIYLPKKSKSGNA